MVSSIRAIPSLIAPSESIVVSWKQPPANGSAILHYYLDFGEVTNTTTNAAASMQRYVVNGNGEMQIDYTIHNLQPDTIYKLRIQAANIMGFGPFSNLIKVKFKDFKDKIK